jgi:hypothetical protein
VSDDRRLLSILCVGSPELDRMVENDPSIGARVDVRVRMQPLDMANATKYLAHRLGAVNGKAEILPPAAMDALFKIGRGRPRLLNTLADNALFEAYLAGRTSIEASDIERAASDLGIGGDPGTSHSEASVAPPMPSTPSTMGSPHDSNESIFSLDEALDEEEPEAVPELELTSSMAVEEESSASVPTIDLDAGLEAALEDFAKDLPATSAENSAVQEIEPEPLVLEEEGEIPDVLAEASIVESIDVSEDGVLDGIELIPIEAGDSDEFDDVFVELIEE